MQPEIIILLFMRFWIVMITSKIPLKIDHMYSDAYENRYSTTVHTFVFLNFLVMRN